MTTLCQHFQVGRIAAVNQLRNLQLITEDDRSRMLARSPASTLPANHADGEVGAIGLRAGVLRELTLRAAAAGRISGLQARSLLDLSAAESLPEAPGLSPELRRPLVDVTSRVERVVLQRLMNSAALADCYVDRIDVEADGWRVEVKQASFENDEPDASRGFVVLGPDLQILEEHLTPRTA